MYYTPTLCLLAPDCVCLCVVVCAPSVLVYFSSIILFLKATHATACISACISRSLCVLWVE